LEVLEDRLVPATFTMTTPLDVVDPNDGQLSLREAVTAANADPGPDTIVVPAGVYRLTIPGVENANAAGDLDVDGTTLFLGAGPTPRSSTASSSTVCSTCSARPPARSQSSSRA
jgi:hypothetical protein